MADIANYPLVPADALNFVRIVRGQKLDTSIVDGEPYLDFYEFARFPIGADLGIGTATKTARRAIQFCFQ